MLLKKRGKRQFSCKDKKRSESVMLIAKAAKTKVELISIGKTIGEMLLSFQLSMIRVKSAR